MAEWNQDAKEIVRNVLNLLMFQEIGKYFAQLIVGCVLINAGMKHVFIAGNMGIIGIMSIRNHIAVKIDLMMSNIFGHVRNVIALLEIGYWNCQKDCNFLSINIRQNIT